MQFDVIDAQICLLESDQRRREAWIDLCSPIWTSTLDRSKPIMDDVRFRGWRSDSAVFYAMHASPQMIERTTSQINSMAVDHIHLQMHYNGSSLLNNKMDELNINRGDIAFIDLSQPATIKTSTGVSGVSVCMPRRLFDPRLGELGDLHRHILSGRDKPLHRLLSEHLMNVQHCLDTSDGAQRNSLALATIALCNAALTPNRDSAYNGHGVIKVEIRQFIEDNIDRFDLSIEMLCARFGMSRTPIYVMFEAEGGVMTYIRNRRLAQAMRILSGIEESGLRRISSVAHACGYENLKSFSKAFYARYGLNPRDVDRASSFRTAAHLEVAAMNMAWIKEL